MEPALEPLEGHSPGARGYLVDVDVNLLLQPSADVSGFDLIGAEARPSQRRSPEVYQGTQWERRALSFNFERQANSDVLVTLTGAGLSKQVRTQLLHTLVEIIDETSSEHERASGSGSEQPTEAAADT